MADQEAPLEIVRQARQPAENFRSVWRDWLISLSKELQPLLMHTVVFSVFILCEMLLLRLIDFAFSDVTQVYPVLDFLPFALKVASIFVISFHFLGSCITEIEKTRKERSTRIKEKK
ncbi:MAG TPA: hypothetical protein VGF67_26165 [Ktedonobacteraceae bacterium]|jgi:hypothetical protein